MDKEIVFAQTLEKVRRIAKEQGNCISQARVKEEFSSLNLSEAQFGMVFDYLVQHGIGVGEPVDTDEFLTKEERDSLQEYLDEIAALTSCTEGEKEAVTLLAMAGEAEGRKRLVEIYLKDVADIARLYGGQGVSLEDLIGEGNVALTMGVSRLGSLKSPSEVQGMLGKQIMDAMEELIRENAANEKKDKQVADKVNQVADKARELAEELHRKVTPVELASETGISLKVIEDAMRMSGYKIEDIDWKNFAESGEAGQG